MNVTENVFVFSLTDKTFICSQNKENGNMDAKKIRRALRASSANCETKFYDSSDEKRNSTLMPSDRGKSASNGNLPTRLSPIRPMSSTVKMDYLDGTLTDGDRTITMENGSSKSAPGSHNSSFESQMPLDSPSKLMKPPPLPPKPKSLLTKSITISPPKVLQRIVPSEASNKMDDCQKKVVF